MIILPFLTAFLLGFALLRLCLNRTPAPLSLRIFLAPGLGLGVISGITFLLILAGRGVHPDQLRGVLFVITAAAVIAAWHRHPPARPVLTVRTLTKGWTWIVLALMLFPLWLQARGYPYGGWDAWQVWNFKAKFLLLSGDAWPQLFSPSLWRSSPHYPLLLPLINVWIWLFTPGPDPRGPMSTAFLFTVMTAGLLHSALRRRVPALAALGAVLILLTWPSYALTSVSQYCDVVLGYYLLAALVCLLRMREGYPAFALPAGIFTGLLAFTKPEGAVAALLLAGLTSGLMIVQNRRSERWPLGLFAAGGAAGAVPAVLFRLIYSPGNQTFINGLTDPDKPALLERLFFILAYIGMTLIRSPSWLWLGGGLLLAGRRAWRKTALLPALFLGGYMSTVIGYYYVNTYFKIAWWLQVSLERILFALLPVIILWVVSALGTPKKVN